MIMKTADCMPEVGRTVLVFAKWHWDADIRSLGDDGEQKTHEWRVAELRVDHSPNCVDQYTCFVSITNNPYCDVAVDAIFWSELPSTPSNIGKYTGVSPVEVI